LLWKSQVTEIVIKYHYKNKIVPGFTLSRNKLKLKLKLFFIYKSAKSEFKVMIRKAINKEGFR